MSPRSTRTLFDLTRIGPWGELPFFETNLPEIETALLSETEDVFPPSARVFAALEACPPDNVRVILLGQDPYHTPGKADGLAFSIPDKFGGRLDSIGNIFKEIESDLGTARTRTDLSDWAQQGVLLLNTALTVPVGRPKAHAKLGWSVLVTQVLARLDAQPRAAILWGGPAQSYAKALTHPEHLILKAPHPSPLSAHRGFFDSRPFSTVNDWLIKQGNTPIRWTDPA